MPNSIRIKFIVWFVCVFSLLYAGLGFFLYRELEETLLGSVDEHLMSEVQMLANLLSVEESHGQLEMEILELASAATGDYEVPLSGRYYQIVDAKGKVLGRSPSLSEADKFLPVQDVSYEPVFETIKGPDNGPLRILHRSFDYSIGTLTIQAADSLKESYQTLESFRNILLVVFPSAFAVSLFIIFLMTGHVLKPLKEFSRKISQVTELNLNERIPLKGLAEELKPLAKSFNTMLSRLEEFFIRQRQFFSDASHELRTPTSVIKSSCEVALSRERSPEEYRKALEKNLEVANRMSTLVNRILEVSRLDGRMFSLEIKDLDIKALMEDVSRLLEPEAARKDVTIKVEGANIHVPGDRDVLAEAFINIVDNAIKYNRTGGRVDISVAEKNGFAVVTVEDTGIGMSDADRARIFDRFYRADSSRGRAQGTGLGLSIVKSIIEAHRGVILVKSEVGKGSRFEVLLPKRFGKKTA